MVKKCKYYILYPRDRDENIEVKCLSEPPKAIDYPASAIAIGGSNTKKEVQNRLNWMNIPKNKRPKGY